MPLTFARRKSHPGCVRKPSIEALRAGLKRWSLFLGSMLFGMAMGILTLAFVLAGDIYEYQDTVDGVHLPQVDAIICLAGGRGRIMAAGDIWYRYWELSQSPVRGAGRSPQPVTTVTTPLLYVSGMGPQSNWQVFARQLRRGVNEVIRPEDVILERESQNTDANAEWVASYAAERDWERVLLVTS